VLVYATILGSSELAATSRGTLPGSSLHRRFMSLAENPVVDQGVIPEAA
jgi:hypothetical protein